MQNPHSHSYQINPTRQKQGKLNQYLFLCPPQAPQAALSTPSPAALLYKGSTCLSPSLPLPGFQPKPPREKIPVATAPWDQENHNSPSK